MNMIFKISPYIVNKPSYRNSVSMEEWRSNVSQKSSMTNRVLDYMIQQIS